MKKEIHAIRGLDDEVYRKFREKALVKRLKVGEALNLAMRKWVIEEGREIVPDPKNLLKLSGIIKTKKKVRWSEEVDEILYGWKK